MTIKPPPSVKEFAQAISASPHSNALQPFWDDPRTKGLYRIDEVMAELVRSDLLKRFLKNASVKNETYDANFILEEVVDGVVKYRCYWRERGVLLQTGTFDTLEAAVRKELDRGYFIAR